MHFEHLLLYLLGLSALVAAEVGDVHSNFWNVDPDGRAWIGTRNDDGAYYVGEKIRLFWEYNARGSLEKQDSLGTYVHVGKGFVDAKNVFSGTVYTLNETNVKTPTLRRQFYDWTIPEDFTNDNRLAEGDNFYVAIFLQYSWEQVKLDVVLSEPFTILTNKPGSTGGIKNVPNTETSTSVDDPANPPSSAPPSQDNKEDEVKDQSIASNNNPESASPEPTRKKSNTGMIAGIAGGVGGIVLILVVVTLMLARRRKKRAGELEMPADSFAVQSPTDGYYADGKYYGEAEKADVSGVMELPAQAPPVYRAELG